MANESPFLLDGEAVSGISREVAEALAQARAFGYLGPGPLQTHIDHAHGFGDALLASGFDADRPFSVVDLGSGGGVPGLVLAERWPVSSWTFVDSNQRRMQTLRDVLAGLGWTARSSVIVERAEVAGRLPALRGSFSAVVARGFAAPSVTAECACGFLQVGGRLVVSEPPEGPDRWSDRGLAKLGLQRRSVPRNPFRFFVGEQTAMASSVYPRAVGVPAKTPIFDRS